MARRIPLAKIGDYSRDKYEKLLRYVVFETDKQLKEGSPVDTGRLRLSWSISENDAPGYDPGPQSAIPDITPPRRLNYGTERAGNVYHIHTNMGIRITSALWRKFTVSMEWQLEIKKESDRKRLS
jgi:hypothetical protein